MRGEGQRERPLGTEVEGVALKQLLKRPDACIGRKER